MAQTTHTCSALNKILLAGHNLYTEPAQGQGKAH